MAVIRGTGDAKKAKMQVLPGTKDPINFRGIGDTRKLRCKKCGELATQMPDGKGGMQTQCSNCGATYKSTPI